MTGTRYAARYDGKAWGVWDRRKECWLLYPVTSNEARQTARDQNASVPEKKPNQKIETVPDMPTPTYTNRPAWPDFGLEYKLPDVPLSPTLGQFYQTPPIIGPRAILGAMLAGMQEEMEEIREREMAKLPVQPLAIPICSHCSEIELRKRSRN